MWKSYARKMSHISSLTALVTSCSTASEVRNDRCWCLGCQPHLSQQVLLGQFCRHLARWTALPGERHPDGPAPGGQRRLRAWRLLLGREGWRRGLWRLWRQLRVEDVLRAAGAELDVRGGQGGGGGEGLRMDAAQEVAGDRRAGCWRHWRWRRERGRRQRGAGGWRDQLREQRSGGHRRAPETVEVGLRRGPPAAGRGRVEAAGLFEGLQLVAEVGDEAVDLQGGQRARMEYLDRRRKAVLAATHVRRGHVGRRALLVGVRELLVAVLEMPAQVPLPLVRLAAHEAHLVADARVGLRVLLQVRRPLGVVVAALGRTHEGGVVGAVNVGAGLVDLGLRQSSCPLLGFHFSDQRM